MSLSCLIKLIISPLFLIGEALFYWGTKNNWRLLVDPPEEWSRFYSQSLLKVIKGSDSNYFNDAAIIPHNTPNEEEQGIKMARLARFFIKDQPQHIIQRGNNRQDIFTCDDDYKFYLECLGEAAERHKLKIHAYVLMNNHVHLLASPQEAQSIPKTLQSVGRRYVQYFNYYYDRTGTLWEGRYKATLIDSDRYLFTCMRYIELNPLRAKMVKHPKNYPWSSYHHNAQGRTNRLITPHRLYLSLGKKDTSRQTAYRGLFKERLNPLEIDTIREATNKAWALGAEKFKQKVEKMSGRRATPKPKGRPRKNEATDINIRV